MSTLAEDNMEYLKLDRSQYVIHCKIMNKLSLMPEGMRAYCERMSRRFGYSGDGLACWVAEYIKEHPAEVGHLA